MSRSGSLRVGDYLGHIIEAIDNISEYTEDMDLVAFLLDKKTKASSSEILRSLVTGATTGWSAQAQSIGVLASELAYRQICCRVSRHR